MQDVFSALSQPFDVAAPRLGLQALTTVAEVLVCSCAPAWAGALLIDCWQAKGVFATERLTPRLQRLDPMAGLRRLFGLDAVVELLKALIKAALLLAVSVAVLRHSLPRYWQWSAAAARSAGPGFQGLLSDLLLWATLSSGAVALIDLLWQRHRFKRKMRMSPEEIRRDLKESEGDPQVRSHRERLHEELAHQHAAVAAAGAHVLVVNPTHLAIAIDYDRQHCPVPRVSAKGQAELARVLREAAEAAGVPVLRNAALARTLMLKTEVGELVPADCFEIMSEIILWARELRRNTTPASAASARQADVQGGA